MGGSALPALPALPALVSCGDTCVEVMGMVGDGVPLEVLRACSCATDWLCGSEW